MVQRLALFAALVLCWLSISRSGVCVGTSVTMTQELRDEFLRLHNQARSNVGVAPMTYDLDLEADSEVHTDECIWAHSNNDPDIPKTKNGENLAARAGGTVAASSQVSGAMNGWVQKEIGDWNCQANTCNKNKVCGHYTQVVWAKSTKVGCQLAVCDVTDGRPPSASWNRFGKWYLATCQYSPPGNYRGQRPFPVSQCSLTTTAPTSPPEVNSGGEDKDADGATVVTTNPPQAAASSDDDGDDGVDEGSTARDRRVKFRAIIKLPASTDSRKQIGNRIAIGLQKRLRKTFANLVVRFVGWTLVGSQSRRLLDDETPQYDAELNFSSSNATNAADHFKKRMSSPSDAQDLSDMMAASVSAVDSTAGASMRVASQDVSVQTITTSPFSKEPEADSSTALVAIIVSVVMVLGILGGAFVWVKRKQAKDSPAIDVNSATGISASTESDTDMEAGQLVATAVGGNNGGDELQFDVGAKINVVKQSRGGDDSIWFGILADSGKSGWFPAKLVEVHVSDRL